MGRFAGFLTFLIFLDLFFIITGQIGEISGTSIILNTLLGLENIFGGLFYTVIFVTAIGGVAALFVGVVTGIINKAGIEFLIFTTLTITFATMAADFISIYVHLASLNVVWATVIFAPIIIIYLFTTLEWLKNKD